MQVNILGLGGMFKRYGSRPPVNPWCRTRGSQKGVFLWGPGVLSAPLLGLKFSSKNRWEFCKLLFKKPKIATKCFIINDPASDIKPWSWLRILIIQAYKLTSCTSLLVCFDLIWFDLIRFGLVWFYLIWFGLIWWVFVWFNLVWLNFIRFGLVWFDLIWFDLIWFDLIWFDLIRFGLVWFGFI